MIFQAGLTVIEKKFIEEPEYDEPEPLRMEHFHLPLGMWFVGILISLFCFLAEIINNRRRKSKNKTEVPMEPQEDPRVTPQSESSPRAGRLSDTEGAEADLAVDLAGGSTQH